MIFARWFILVIFGRYQPECLSPHKFRLECRHVVLNVKPLTTVHQSQGSSFRCETYGLSDWWSNRQTWLHYYAFIYVPCARIQEYVWGNSSCNNSNLFHLVDWIRLSPMTEVLKAEWSHYWSLGKKSRGPTTSTSFFQCTVYYFLQVILFTRKLPSSLATDVLSWMNIGFGR